LIYILFSQKRWCLVYDITQHSIAEVIHCWN